MSAIRPSGRLRGRPAAPGRRGTRMASSTAPSPVLSWRWPAVTTTESGRPFPSQERCTLLVDPPRLRPIASSGGWKIPFCVLVARFATRACGVLVGAGDGAVYARLSLQLARRIGFGLRMGQQAISGAVTPPAHETVVVGLPRAVARWQVAPRRTGPKLPEYAVYYLAMVFSLLTPSPVFGQKRHDLVPYLIRRLATSDQCCQSPRLSLPAARRLAEKALPFVRHALAAVGDTPLALLPAI